jgi:glycosyltransferase involved in cell wall biosynthesis
VTGANLLLNAAINAGDVEGLHEGLRVNVPSSCNERIRVSGKFFRAGEEKWYARGLCYGPFAPNGQGEFLPGLEQVERDFTHMRQLGATCVRVYFPPPKWLLDKATEYGLRVFVDVPWEKHRCFFEDWSSQQGARDAVRRTARDIGSHPAVFAISVANELPNDVVRFYGATRIQKFLGALLDIVHQEAPDCLATYANFPTTEFVQPIEQDFACFNLYLDDCELLGKYIDRLQHVAGNSPLLISEFGLDSLRQGEEKQAALLTDYLKTAYRHGAAGAFIFSYTDDWFTGGWQVKNWAFGITREDRSEKAAARQIRTRWKDVRQGALRDDDLPRVSVVVCSYNGAATLEECLLSLMKLNYPDYEVILVDDGSVDTTAEIAAQFPQINFIRQQNSGLSAARNVGLRAATGEIVAYMDSDCVADEDWLWYLAHGMLQQGVDAIGGLNLCPATDNWIAKCVAVSPGNPSHVMFDDQSAEHVPGCNMAFRRSVLVSLGGFDRQFRQAGDDVDICWRLLEEGYQIGFAAAAMVWHHRRPTARAYYRQQKGYGRAEGMLAIKHPQRFAASGQLRFDGVIYGDGKAGLPLVPARVYHGRFGSALFQTIYQPTELRSFARATSLEWHLLSALFLLFSTLVPALALISAAMWITTIVSVCTTVRNTRMPSNAPFWCPYLVFWLHLTQPIVRGLHRNASWVANKRLRPITTIRTQAATPARHISAIEREFDWETTNGKGRADLLNALVEEARRNDWPGDFSGGWVPWDIELIADPWHHVLLHTATEELGDSRRFTRARWTAAPTKVKHVVASCVVIWSAGAVAAQFEWAAAIGGLACAVLLSNFIKSRRRSLSAVGELIWNAAEVAGLVEHEPARKAAPHAASAVVKRNQASNGHSNGHVAEDAERSHEAIGQN